MPTIISRSSIETVSRLIRKEFDGLKGQWHDQAKKELIQTATNYGLNDLANELKKRI